MKEMGELGLIGIDSPEEYGGTELDKIASCIVTEGVSRGGLLPSQLHLEFKQV